ncbi:hypothetical protein ACFQ6U_18810 [Streptomyces sp. NPDC056465]|uniref:hypothetical protein n=1 Tax=Streptomyces sp. NPDC056465 TaxID=3345829 RepID=UPI0036AAFDAF
MTPKPKTTTLKRPRALSAPTPPDATPAPTQPADAPAEPLVLNDLRPVATDLVSRLGAPWMVEDPTTTAERLRLIGPDNRELGLALIFTGTVVQMWITGFALPDLPKTASKQEHAVRARRLAPGRSWHIAQPLSHLTPDDAVPAAVGIPEALYRRVTDDLLPAYEVKPPYVAVISWGNEPAATDEKPADEPPADIPRATPAPKRAPAPKKPRRRSA